MGGLSPTRSWAAIVVLLGLLLQVQSGGGDATSTKRDAAAAVKPALLASRIEGAFFGALVADALSLGSHYEFDSRRISKAYGTGGKLLTRFPGPGEILTSVDIPDWGIKNRVHPNAEAGDQTDYGEYNVLFLEYLATTAGKPEMLDIDKFLPHWMDVRAARSSTKPPPPPH